MLCGASHVDVSRRGETDKRSNSKEAEINTATLFENQKKTLSQRVARGFVNRDPLGEHPDEGDL
jgi:hypothetical protein